MKDESEIKYKNNKQTFFLTNNNDLLERNKTTWNKTKDLKKIKLGYLPIQDDKYMKNKIKQIVIKCLNVPEDSVEYESFTVISIDSDNSKYYLQVHSGNCAHKIVNTQMIHYLDKSLLESDKNQFFD